jgi:hypothetical protein
MFEIRLQPLAVAGELQLSREKHAHRQGFLPLTRPEDKG